MQDEIWKEIPGYNGRYRVSENGKVYSSFLKREMKACNRGNGYLFVRLCCKGISKNIFIHTLVASAFVENPNNYKEVDYIDGNKSNNHYSNLRFVLHSENMSNPNTEYKRFEAIRRLQGIPVIAYLNGREIGRYDCLSSAAKELNLCCSHIAKHVKGVFKSVKGYTFKKITSL